jgi:hypothetical protein
VGRARQHADIGAGAEHPRLGGAQQHDLHLRMLEAQSLDRVGELNIDAEIVGVELELVAFVEPAFLIHVQGERRDVAVDGELPMAVTRRVGLEIDPRLAIRELSVGVSHEQHSQNASHLPGDHEGAGWRIRM